MTAKGQWQILTIILPGFFTFLLSSMLTLRNHRFYRVLGFITILSLQYFAEKKRTNAPNQTAVNKIAVCLQEKACEMVSLLRRRQLSIKEVWKVKNRQIKDPIAVSYFFFAQASAFVPCHLPPTCGLDLLWLKRKIRDCSQSIPYGKCALPLIGEWMKWKKCFLPMARSGA